MSSASCRIMTVWHGMGVKFNLKHVTALVSFSSLQRRCCFVFGPLMLGSILLGCILQGGNFLLSVLWELAASNAQTRRTLAHRHAAAHCLTLAATGAFTSESCSSVVPPAHLSAVACSIINASSQASATSCSCICSK